MPARVIDSSPRAWLFAHARPEALQELGQRIRVKIDARKEL